MRASDPAPGLEFPRLVAAPGAAGAPAVDNVGAMSLRVYLPDPPATSQPFALPAAAARHVQVRRLQPGDAFTVFDGRGVEWPARVQAMGRHEVVAVLGAAQPVDRELPLRVTLAVGVPANERMDWLVEKATELGVASIRPLQCERSVLRLDGERGQRRREHWQSVAEAAAGQCGRTRLPTIAPMQPLAAMLAATPPDAATLRWVLSLRADAVTPRRPHGGAVTLLSGPEGGLSPAEEDAARAAGWQPVTLGPRVLRAETAPLAVLAWLSLPG